MKEDGEKVKNIDKIKLFIRNRKKEDYIVCTLIGILLVVLTIPTSKEEKRTLEEKKNAQFLMELQDKEDEIQVKKEKNQEEYSKLNEKELNNTYYYMETYVEEMEKKLKELLEDMEGAGNVEVMISVSASGKRLVEKDTSDQAMETIYYETKDGQQIPYETGYTTPKITGVVVMAQGAGNRQVKENIIQTVEVLFPVTQHKIKVIKMKS